MVGSVFLVTAVTSALFIGEIYIDNRAEDIYWKNQ